MQLLNIMPIISTLSIYIRRTRIRVGTNTTDFSTSNSKLEIGSMHHFKYFVVKELITI